jgi:hypothetical protein
MEMSPDSPCSQYHRYLEHKTAMEVFYYFKIGYILSEVRILKEKIFNMFILIQY